MRACSYGAQAASNLASHFLRSHSIGVNDRDVLNNRLPPKEVVVKTIENDYLHVIRNTTSGTDYCKAGRTQAFPDGPQPVLYRDTSCHLRLTPAHLECAYSGNLCLVESSGAIGWEPEAKHRRTNVKASRQASDSLAVRVQGHVHGSVDPHGAGCLHMNARVGQVPSGVNAWEQGKGRPSGHGADGHDME